MGSEKVQLNAKVMPEVMSAAKRLAQFDGVTLASFVEMTLIDTILARKDDVAAALQTNVAQAEAARTEWEEIFQQVEAGHATLPGLES